MIMFQEKCCWKCKFFTRCGGHGSSDWGYCYFIHGNEMVDSEYYCDKFEEK